MRTIGLIGGMSWESTAYYYRAINTEVKERLGGLHSARLVLCSVDFAEIEALQIQGDWDKAGRVLGEYAQKLELAGAHCVVVCTNTMHKVADQIQGAVSIPLLHIADATANYINGVALEKIGLLGTRFTMEQEFYRGRLEKSHGLSVIVPDERERGRVHEIIYNELCKGIVREDSRQEYRTIIETLVRKGAQGVILGCTEIGLLLSEGDCSVPVFDTTRIHAAAAVAFALGQ